MQFLLKISAVFDRLLGVVARLGAASGLVLVVVVCIDVATRYFGVAKPFNMNSTQLQEAEYWFHTFFFTLMIGWAYTKNAHVRIDLISSTLRAKTRLIIEMIGCLFFLFAFSCLGIWYSGEYAWTSYVNDESSKSVLGLENVWILKFALFAMFVMMALSAISQFIKSLASFLQMQVNGAPVDPFEVR